MRIFSVIWHNSFDYLSRVVLVLAIGQGIWIALAKFTPKALSPRVHFAFLGDGQSVALTTFYHSYPIIVAKWLDHSWYRGIFVLVKIMSFNFPVLLLEFYFSGDRVKSFKLRIQANLSGVKRINWLIICGHISLILRTAFLAVGFRFQHNLNSRSFIWLNYSKSSFSIPILPHSKYSIPSVDKHHMWDSPVNRLYRMYNISLFEWLNSRHLKIIGVQSIHLVIFVLADVQLYRPRVKLVSFWEL